MSGQTIGQRIQTRRKLSGRSIRNLADEAGISHTTWSRIERGERGADNRVILGDIARALRCSTSELIGQPAEPTTRDEAHLAGHVNSLLAALVDTDLDDEATVPVIAWGALQHEAELLDDLYQNVDFAGVAGRLAPFTRQLHAATVAATGIEERRVGLRMTVLGASRTSRLLRAVGRRAEAYLAGERAQDAAERLEDPVILANAYRTRASDAMGCGSHSRAYKLTTRGLEALAGHMDEEGAAETAGHLHLRSAMALYALHRGSEGDAHLAEAEALAARTGDTDTFGLFFGPTNLAFWRLAIEIDSGDPHDAVHIAQTTNPAAIGSVDRQGAFYLDAARALARLGTREADTSAIRMLATAERIAPQRTRSYPFAKETLRVILERAKRSAVDSRLRGLAERIGVAA